VNYQLLSLQVSSPLRGAEDADWTHAALRDCAWDIANANPVDPGLHQAERDAARGWSIRQVDIRLLSTVIFLIVALTAWCRNGEQRTKRHASQPRPRS
jgi:hypothetical protein